MSVDVLVVGGLNSDFLGRGPKLPTPGDTQSGDTFFEGPGGKGANQAVACARLGARVALIGAVGDDERGRELANRIRAEGVDVTFVRRIAGMPTGAALIHVDTNAEKQILSIPGANHGLARTDLEHACAKCEQANVVLAQLEVRIECVEAAFKWGRAVGAKTVLDPAPAISLSDDLLKLVDFIKPNAREAEVLTGVDADDRETARKAARKLIGRGVGAVAIQAGEEGNLIVWRDGEHFLPRLKVAAVDATGAGDAFAGTLATYLARGRPLVEAATFANAAAAFKTTAVGAQTALPREIDIQTLLNRK